MPEDLVQTLIDKTFQELNAPARPQQKSRIWQDPNGYQYLGVWQNAALLRVLVRKFTLTLPLWEKRLKAQMDDCARSQKRNIEEGWKRPTTSEYLQFLGYSQASLEELKGDIRDAKTDGFLKSVKGSDLLRVGIDIRVIKGPQSTWGEPTEQTHPYYQPLNTLNPKTLTYEIFIELINKTDWLLRKLVESLENKLSNSQKDYQINQARIREAIKKK
ncbi:MAG TPA: four helix bundle protein [Patescibacteria group bacterium]|nr:four helix bundle protein [Patescibacteria group bacterium]